MQHDSGVPVTHNPSCAPLPTHASPHNLTTLKPYNCHNKSRLPCRSEFNGYFTEFLRQNPKFQDYVTVECQNDLSYTELVFGPHVDFEKYPRFLMHSTKFVTNIAWAWYDVLSHQCQRIC